MLLRPLAYVKDLLDIIYYFGSGIWFLVMACLQGFTQVVCGMKKDRHGPFIFATWGQEWPPLRLEACWSSLFVLSVSCTLTLHWLWGLAFLLFLSP